MSKQTLFQADARMAITSATLSKAYRQMILYDCGTISAERGKLRAPKGANGKERRKEYREHLWYLKNELQEKYSVTMAVGGWPDGPNGDVAGEVSLWVVDTANRGTLGQDLQELAQEYAQDSIVFKPKNQRAAKLYGTARPASYSYENWDLPSADDAPGLGEEPWDIGKASFGVPRRMVTKLRGRPFAFGDEYNPKFREPSYQEKKAKRTQEWEAKKKPKDLLGQSALLQALRTALDPE